MDYETNRIITQEEFDKMGEELSNYAESLINQQFKKISNDMDTTYEQKYKEANDKVVARFGTNVAKEIFTDLYESEDERIRKDCIKYLNWEYQHCPLDEDKMKIEKCIVWLEKQKNCEYIRKDWLERIKQSWYKEGFIDGKYTPKEWTINDATTLNGLIDFLENGTAKLQHDLTLYANWLKTQFSPIEKQGRQETTDKVEPKFKVGDRIVFNGLVLLIKEVVQGYYRTISVNGIPHSYDWDIDNVARLWTAQDAKVMAR